MEIFGKNKQMHKRSSLQINNMIIKNVLMINKLMFNKKNRIRIKKRMKKSEKCI